jgi:hypothetical protein
LEHGGPAAEVVAAVGHVSAHRLSKYLHEASLSEGTLAGFSIMRRKTPVGRMRPQLSTRILLATTNWPFGQETNTAACSLAVPTDIYS